MKLNYSRNLTDAQGRHLKGDPVTAGPRRCRELLAQGLAAVAKPARPKQVSKSANKPGPKP